MSLAKWIIGFLTFQVIIVVFLIGTSSIYTDASYTDDAFIEAGFNSSDSVDMAELSWFDKFTYSVGNLPFPVNVLVGFPTAISIILGALYLRGVN